MGTDYAEQEEGIARLQEAQLDVIRNNEAFAQFVRAQYPDANLSTPEEILEHLRGAGMFEDLIEKARGPENRLFTRTALQLQSDQFFIDQGTAEVTVARTEAAMLSGDFAGGFDAEAAARVYDQAGTLDINGWDLGQKIMHYFTSEDITGDDINIDATIRGSSVETNLAALSAGAAGTEMADEIAAFSEVILQYPELKESFGDLLQNEGVDAVAGMQELLAGEGGMDMAEFRTRMENPTYRAAINQVFAATATDRWQMADAVRFSQLMNDAARDPLNREKREALRQHGTAMGVDMDGLFGEAQQEVMTEMFSGMLDKFMSGDIEGFMQDLNRMIVTGIESMGLPEQTTNQLISVASGVTGFYVDSVGYYAFGDGQQPGLVQIVQSGMANADASGAALRTKFASAVTPAAPANTPDAPEAEDVAELTTGGAPAYLSDRRVAAAPSYS